SGLSAALFLTIPIHRERSHRLEKLVRGALLRFQATPPRLALPPHPAGGRHSQDHDGIKSTW
ncbi:MAG: hypothetical protein WBN38_14600, partial [Polyangiales bacterium]